MAEISQPPKSHTKKRIDRLNISFHPTTLSKSFYQQKEAQIILFKYSLVRIQEKHQVTCQAKMSAKSILEYDGKALLSYWLFKSPSISTETITTALAPPPL